MINKPSLADAILKLRPNSAFILQNEDLFKLEWKDKDTIPPTAEEINIEYSKLLNEYESYDYWRKRRESYPSVQDQFDVLYHEGYEGWRKMINDIKERYPKEKI